MKTPLYRRIASRIDARIRSMQNGNKDWHAKHTSALRAMQDHLPSGAGIDNGTTIDLDESRGEKIVLRTSFHHMDEQGGYDGWTEHAITITPSLLFGIEIKISGRDRNDIKDYLADVFQTALTEEYEATIEE
jgi:hypothetical protein